MLGKERIRGAASGSSRRLRSAIRLRSLETLYPRSPPPGSGGGDRCLGWGWGNGSAGGNRIQYDLGMSEVEVIVRASPLHDKRRLSRVKGELLRRIQAAGGVKIAEVEQPTPERLTAMLILTGGVEREALKTVSHLPSPVLLIAHPTHNSLPAALEILARIRQDGGEGRILFGPPEEIAAGLREEMTLAEAWEELRFSRIGLIGEPSDWLVASGVDHAFVKGRLSVELVEVAIDELVERVEKARVPKKEIAAFIKGAGAVEEPDPADIRGAIAIYKGLRSLVDEHRLAALTVRCFDLLGPLGNTGCYALSRLNDEGIPAGCEGDLQSLFSLYIGFLLSGRPAFMGNISSIDPDGRTVGISHCTCPLTLTEGYAIRSHFESGLGVGISGEFPTGPCTLFRFGGERLDQLFVGEGTIEEAPFREDLCRTQVRAVMRGPVDSLLTAPLGNHHVLVFGHHAAVIGRFFKRHLGP